MAPGEREPAAREREPAGGERQPAEGESQRVEGASQRVEGVKLRTEGDSRLIEVPVSMASPNGDAASAGSTISLSGVVDAYRSTAPQEPGAITVGGLLFPIAPGTILAGDPVQVGHHMSLDAKRDVSGQIVQGTATEEAVEEEKSWVRFTIELSYLILLILGALIYHDTGHNAVIGPIHEFLVGLFPDPIGSIPLVIPWLGALGSVARGLANSYGEVDYIQHSAYRPRHYNSLGWYIARPFIGIAFGIFVFTFFLAVLDPTGKTKPGGEFGMDILAFIIGYADGTFAALVQRAINVLLGPGDAGPAREPERSVATGSANK